jgi:hypothetical protein
MKILRRAFMQAIAGAAGLLACGRTAKAEVMPEFESVLRASAWFFMQNATLWSNVINAATIVHGRVVPHRFWDHNIGYVSYGIVADMLLYGNAFALNNRSYSVCLCVPEMSLDRDDLTEELYYLYQDNRLADGEVTHFRQKTTIAGIKNDGWCRPPYLPGQQVNDDDFTVDKLVASIDPRTLTQLQNWVEQRHQMNFHVLHGGSITPYPLAFKEIGRGPS